MPRPYHVPGQHFPSGTNTTATIDRLNKGTVASRSVPKGIAFEELTAKGQVATRAANTQVQATKAATSVRVLVQQDGRSALIHLSNGLTSEGRFCRTDWASRMLKPGRGERRGSATHLLTCCYRSLRTIASISSMNLASSMPFTLSATRPGSVGRTEPLLSKYRPWVMVM